MFNTIDLKELAQVSGPERAFVSLYLSTPESYKSLSDRIVRLRSMLSEDPAEAEHFEHNLEIVEKWLAEHTWTTEGACLFVCWALDFVRAHPLTASVPDLIWVDSSPYIRPLAELQDEYENFVVVVADNSAARVFFITSAMTSDPDARIKGDVKNSVKKGGWSQKRYERRRGKELLLYAKEIADVLAEIDGKETFARLILVGSEETMLEIEKVLPAPVAAKLVARRNVDLSAGDDQAFDAAFELFSEEERAEEVRLWDRIKEEYCRGALAVAGPDEVLKAAAVGRVERLAVTRDAEISGVRCRDCENLSAGKLERCPICKSESIFRVDLVNELVELLALSSAEADFVDPIPGLAEVGDVAALLRY